MEAADFFTEYGEANRYAIKEIIGENGEREGKDGVGRARARLKEEKGESPRGRDSRAFLLSETHLSPLSFPSGKGSYGIVCSAVDTLTGQKVAIKKINNVFDHVSDATRILREIKLLRLLRHPDIVEVRHIMLPPSPRDFKDIYVVFELMETDLHQVRGMRRERRARRGERSFFLSSQPALSIHPSIFSFVLSPVPLSFLFRSSRPTMT